MPHEKRNDGVVILPVHGVYDGWRHLHMTSQAASADKTILPHDLNAGNALKLAQSSAWPLIIIVCHVRLR